MNFTLLKASEEYTPVFNNLMQFYIYDFSAYLDYDVEENGLFASYPGLAAYWEEDKKYPYLITKGNKYAGFVLVKLIQSASATYFSIAEFFVLKKYRRKGAGRKIAFEIFNLHRGQWEVYQKEQNKPAQIFWNKIIAEYTSGIFTERSEDGRRIQDFNNSK